MNTLNSNAPSLLALFSFFLAVSSFCPGTAICSESPGQIIASVATCEPILTWEPIIMDITVMNKGEEPIFQPSRRPVLHTHDKRVIVHTKLQEEDDYSIFESYFHVSDSYSLSLPIYKNESFHIRAIVLTGIEWGHPLDESGSYELKADAKYLRRDESDSPVEIFAESSAISINVKAATGDDKEAKALWGIAMTGAVGIEECGQTYLGMAEYAEESNSKIPLERYEALDILREAYPDTIYGQYARFLRADPWSHRLPGMLTEPEERAGVFRQFVESPTPFPLRDEAMLRLAECYLDGAGGSREDALALLDELIREYPESPVIPEAEEMAARLRQ